MTESAPDGIPADVWEAAKATFREMTAEVEGSDDREIIARAILAERKRLLSGLLSPTPEMVKAGMWMQNYSGHPTDIIIAMVNAYQKDTTP